jgi:hypothetical protein
MGDYRIEEIDFLPQVPVVRLVLTCLAFGALGWAFINEVWFEFQLAGRLTLTDLVEAVGIGLLLLTGFCFITSFLLLQFRLRFTEAGLRRLTLFGPRFIPWSAVRAAQIESYRGNLVLTLRVSQRRWVCVPLLEFRRSARLLAEIRRRVTVEVRASERQLALLCEQEPGL